MAEKQIECADCDASVWGVDTAIESGWIPSYFDGDVEVSHPLCPACVAAKITVDADGEYVLVSI